MDSSKNHWLCIDFGTCNTAAAFLVGGKPHLVSYGNSSFFPTVACVLESGEIQVCQNAEPLRDRFPEFFQQEFKLQIADPVDINGHSYEDIVAEILRFVAKAAALENNNTPLTNALITIPAIYTASDPRKGSDASRGSLGRIHYRRVYARAARSSKSLCVYLRTKD